MIIEEIKRANIQAMRDRDSGARAIYSIVINKHLMATVDARTSGKDVDDGEVLRIVQKTIKELEEERDNYARVGHADEVEAIEYQKKLLEKYLPQMLTEDEIKDIIDTLDDKTVPSVMRHFKSNYNGFCDMKVVSNVLKNMQ